MSNDPVLNKSLFREGERILCAVSGGADSVCLLSLLRDFPGIGIVCAHYDHGIRGRESRRDAQFTEELCREWGIELYTERGDVPTYAREHSLSIETAARTLRYEFLERARVETGCDRIATAHTKNDNAETVLLHLCRGSALRGLGGIPPERGRIIRPLLGATREEIEDYLRRNGIPWTEDSTNREDGYTRNRLRHRVMPLLEEIHPGAAANMARCTAYLREDEELLSAMAAEFLAGQERDSLSVSALLKEPLPIRRRVLRDFIGGELSASHIEAALALCRGGVSDALDLPGVHLYREYDRLCRGEEKGGSLPDFELSVGGFVRVPGTDWEVLSEICPPGTEIQSSFNTFSFSCEKICGKIYFTSRRTGDRIRLPGRDGERSLKKLLIERRIPRAKRELLPVLRDEQGVLAVCGIGQGARALAAPGEAFYKIQLKEIRENS